MYLPLLVFISFVFLTTSQNPEFGKLEIVSDLLPQDCYDQSKDYVNVDENNQTILPKCVEFSTPPKKTKKCERYYQNTGSNDYFYKSISKPVCSKDGNFAPKQCKGERTTGRCFCYNSEGKRIFGQQWWNKAEDMTCACSRRKADMQSADMQSADNPKGPYFNSLHCDSTGNYEPLQCDMVSEQCWCADEKTGDLTSQVVPHKAISRLPCYKSLSVGIQYLRQCESKKFAQAKILYELSLHGTKNVEFEVFNCDDDGSYGNYEIFDGSAYCTWRDGTKVGTWQHGDPDRSTLNCYCARDTKIFANAGKTLKPTCASNGNYKSYQITGGSSNTAYCVDTDGYKKSFSAPNKDSDCDKFESF